MAIRHVALVAAAASALTVAPAVAAGARPAHRHYSSFDQQLLSEINQARGDRGVSPLTLNGSLESMAVNWAQQEAASQRMYDDPNLRTEIKAACPDWQAMGQVVGQAGEATADDLFQKYMHDSAERQQLLARAYTEIGTWSVATNQNGAVVRYNAIDLARGC
jgi:uncharacterized protein YkwD